LIIGGGDTGTLYGAYRFAEALGVRFYLHGDVIPDARIAPTLPNLNETGKPLFATRGIQPFHDFPEGPDWWDRDDQLAYVAQLPKMRMNFYGLHCYPEGHVGPEPLVWIGQPGDVDKDGTVKFSYPAQWANTARDGMWGYAAMKTSEFSAGADQLFPSFDYGPRVQAGLMPRPGSVEESNRLFDRTGAMMHDVFAEARALGVKTCIGTETPLTIPKAVQERLKAQGKDPKDPAVVRELYTGMFQRIAQLYPVDYYWFWTPENWTRQGNNAEQYKATVADIHAALDALKQLNNPFTLATCGWVLGPVSDRAALDKALPKTMPMSCINRQVGHDPVEPGFAAVSGRPKWAIPWMENDPNLTAPQPWAGRMRYDAASALRYGCTGLLGIHWRTKALAPNVAALAAAGWDQSWAPADFTPVAPDNPETKLASGAHGGSIASFAAPVAGTSQSQVYQSVRYNMNGYEMNVPAGVYRVTLQFNEPHYGKAGQRVFGVKIQGKPVIDRLDLIERVGKNKALDFAFDNIKAGPGPLKIEFVKIVEYPCIAGIVVEGKTADGAQFTKKINCGGPKLGDYAADEPARESRLAGGKARGRTMPVEDFYIDFARANFGEAVAEPAGRILARIDGVGLPEPTGWLGGPGAVKPNPEPWEKVREHYAFVGELTMLRPNVRGAGNQDRFDYWLNTYRAMGYMARAGCLRGELDRVAKAIKEEKIAAKRKELTETALKTRIELARTWKEMIHYQIEVTDTPGELGTLANLEQHSRKQQKFLEAHDAELVKALGRPLPPEVQLSSEYMGRARIIVPTVRTLMAQGESITLRVIVLSKADTPSPMLCWRPLGQGEWNKTPLRHVGRAVYEVTLPAAPAGTVALEYYITANSGEPIITNQRPFSGERKLTWPPTAPALNQTVVIGALAK
jgi:hypothetical protein